MDIKGPFVPNLTHFLTFWGPCGCQKSRFSFQISKYVYENLIFHPILIQNLAKFVVFSSKTAICGIISRRGASFYLFNIVLQRFWFKLLKLMKYNHTYGWECAICTKFDTFSDISEALRLSKIKIFIPFSKYILGAPSHHIYVKIKDFDIFRYKIWPYL